MQYKYQIYYSVSQTAGIPRAPRGKEAAQPGRRRLIVWLEGRGEPRSRAAPITLWPAETRPTARAATRPTIRYLQRV